MTARIATAVHPHVVPHGLRNGARWQVQRYEPPFGIAVSAFNVRMSFPADLPANER